MVESWIRPKSNGWSTNPCLKVQYHCRSTYRLYNITGANIVQLNIANIYLLKEFFKIDFQETFPESSPDYYPTDILSIKIICF
jgi:hypothetical protein